LVAAFNEQSRDVALTVLTKAESLCLIPWNQFLFSPEGTVADKKNWVFKGASCLPPEERLCLVQFSDGGKDAVRVREFDLDTNAFVTTGFALPEGKQAVSWIDRHTVLIARDWGEGTLTQVGYPFVLKELKRAQPLVRAREVFRGEPTDAVAALRAAG
jgi:prolyl oligopeptidase